MSKHICPVCSQGTRSLRYHKCNAPITDSQRKNALLGDALHRAEVVRFLFSLGLDQTVSHTVLVSYVHAAHHAAYLTIKGLLPPTHMHLNEHNKSTFFEDLYATDPVFKDMYHKDVLTTVRGTIVTTLDPAVYADQLALDHLPQAAIVPAPKTSYSFGLLIPFLAVLVSAACIAVNSRRAGFPK